MSLNSVESPILGGEKEKIRKDKSIFELTQRVRMGGRRSRRGGYSPGGGTAMRFFKSPLQKSGISFSLFE